MAPQHLPDPSAGHWLTGYLSRLDGSVGQVVPAAYEAYARVLHPAETHDGVERTWREVCTGSGATPHALMQWNSISDTRRVVLPDGTSTEESGWPGSPPDVGSMPVRTWAVLSAVLDGSGQVRPWYLALWEGRGGIDNRGASPGWSRTGDGPWVRNPPQPSAYPDEVLDAPRLELPARTYLLFTGGPGDVFGEDDSLFPQVPNLCWPADRSWCTATEIDVDSTLVGGARELIDAVLGTPELESYEVGPGDSLTADADLVNGVPAPEGRDTVEGISATRSPRPAR